MIPFDFDYYRPHSISEAVELYRTLSQQGKQPKYYSGGTEIITLGRLGQVYTEAVIDINSIPECRVLDVYEGKLYIGATNTLTQCIESYDFPLLSVTANEVADKTVRNKISLGGNICGYIYYREAILPFLLADSEVVLVSPSGIRQISIHEFFHVHPFLKRGEFLSYTITAKADTELPFYSKKVRKQGAVGYPLVTVSALKKNRMIRIAISGLYPYPFRAFNLEEVMNQKGISFEEKWKKAVDGLPEGILNDIEGSSEYRLYRLKLILHDIFSMWEGDNDAEQGQ